MKDPYLTEVQEQSYRLSGCHQVIDQLNLMGQYSRCDVPDTHSFTWPYPVYPVKKNVTEHMTEYLGRLRRAASRREAPSLRITGGRRYLLRMPRAAFGAEHGSYG